MSTFLYNGIPLPDINEVWTDKEKCKSAFVRKAGAAEGSEVEYRLVLAASAECGYNGKDTVQMWHPTVTYKLLSDNWEKIGESDTVGFGTGYANALIIWSSFDVLNADGTLYLAASEPIPVNPAPPIDPTSLLMGWLVGKRIAAMRGQVPSEPQEPDKEPVAYLYNGVRLPDINEVWTDKETYPYASIATVNGVVCLGLQGLQYQTDGTNLIVVPGYKGLWYILSDGAWVYNQIEDYPDGLTIPLSMFTATWTSADIINTTDNSVYLAATEPVPVYE